MLRLLSDEEDDNKCLSVSASEKKKESCPRNRPWSHIEL
jgi:hypothetical protein